MRLICTVSNRAILPFKKTSQSHDNYEIKVYRSSNKLCNDCPLRATCIGKSDFKAITESTEKPLYDTVHQKLQSPYAKQISKIRSKTVEPVLGTLINFTNMRRINSRGIAQANKHPAVTLWAGVLMAALTYNIKKYLKWNSRKSIVKVMEQSSVKQTSKRA